MPRILYFCVQRPIRFFLLTTRSNPLLKNKKTGNKALRVPQQQKEKSDYYPYLIFLIRFRVVLIQQVGLEPGRLHLFQQF